MKLLNFINWIWNNKEWLFSGVGIALLSAIYFLFFNSKSKREKIIKVIKQPQDNKIKNINADQIKKLCNILFIDDDTKFKVVTILKKSGWINTKSIKDIESLDSNIIRDAHIYFVDINGVGALLSFKDEGLGVAKALKEKYPNKKVIIYSAEPNGDRFHDAIRRADSLLSKNADPYEFQQIVEQFSNEMFS